MNSQRLQTRTLDQAAPRTSAILASADRTIRAIRFEDSFTAKSPWCAGPPGPARFFRLIYRSAGHHEAGCSVDRDIPPGQGHRGVTSVSKASDPLLTCQQTTPRE